MPRRRDPPSPDPCLVHSRRTRFRGGTLIAFEVHEVTEHERRVHDADGYRPPACPRCGGLRLHLHDRHSRILLGDQGPTQVEIVRYLCSAPECRATWRILPAFVARHLWRRWSTVARAIAGVGRLFGGPPIPGRTLRRWNARLRSAARQLINLLGQHEDDAVANFVRVAAFDSTRRELIELFTAGRVLGVHGLADIAATIHALEPGVRLM